MTPTEARPHPWPGWEAAAQNALDDLETLALWWRGQQAKISLNYLCYAPPNN